MTISLYLSKNLVELFVFRWAVTSVRLSVAQIGIKSLSSIVKDNKTIPNIIIKFQNKEPNTEHDACNKF